MRVLSASEAVAPAFQRTREILFQKFHWRRSWKLAGVGILSGFAILYMPNIPMMGHAGLPPGTPVAGKIFVLGMSVFMTLFAIVISAITLALFYVGARMQLVLFETVVSRQTVIAPVWRRYGSRTWRWIGIKIIPSAIFFVPFILLILSFSHHMAQQQIQMQQQMQMQRQSHMHGNPLAAFHFMRAFMGFMAGIWFFGGIAMLVSSLIGDFALPSIALEDASFGLAWRRFGEVFQNDPPGTALYVLLKIVLGVVAMIAAYIVVILMVLVPILLVVLFGFLLRMGLGHAGIAGAIVMGLAIALAVLMVLAYLIYIYVLIGGTIFTFFQAFAIYFLGGRYPLLGDLLEPPPIYVAPSVEQPPPTFEPPLPEPAA